MRPGVPRSCPFCGDDFRLPELAAGDPPPPPASGGGLLGRGKAGDRGGGATRLAYDPWRGRLWAVCRRCRRWTAFPLEARWEVLEACEREVRDRGRIRVESENLSLVELTGPGRRGDGATEVVRVGRPPRVEMAGWRYGDRLPRPRPGFWARLLGVLPDPPVGGYDVYGIGALRDGGVPAPWIASPFMEHASRLTRAFSHVPLAPACPSCRRPLLLLPWDFQEVRWVRHRGDRGVTATCGLCRERVFLDAPDARPALRMGLALVTPEPRLRSAAEPAARQVDATGGGPSFLDLLVREGAALGELDTLGRTALTLVLDEEAEMEALEAEWRRAEELTAIMDRELTPVEGFEDFRRRVLDEG